PASSHPRRCKQLAFTALYRMTGYKQVACTHVLEVTDHAENSVRRPGDLLELHPRPRPEQAGGAGLQESVDAAQGPGAAAGRLARVRRADQDRAALRGADLN